MAVIFIFIPYQRFYYNYHTLLRIYLLAVEFISGILSLVKISKTFRMKRGVNIESGLTFILALPNNLYNLYIAANIPPLSTNNPIKGVLCNNPFITLNGTMVLLKIYLLEKVM